MEAKQIAGGICAPQGFTAAGIHAGIRKNKDRKDLAMIKSSVPCTAAAVYTQNKVYGAPITVTRNNLQDHHAQAIICNSGNANTCLANGVEIATEMCDLAARSLGLQREDIIVASTGVIGMPFDIQPIADNIDQLAASLSIDGAHAAATAIMTTDTVPKEIAVEFEIGGCQCRIGAIAKGSGMIHPNMATMLSFITTDAAISPAMLEQSLKEVVKDTYNMISVDGDTSTNDMVAIMANGLSGNKEITTTDTDYQTFTAALRQIATVMAKKIASDGEGATRLMECIVTGAPDQQTARNIAKSVITSSLTKAAIFGADANWGRVLCAIGYTEGDFAVDRIAVSFSSAKGTIDVCRNGAGIDFSEEKAKEILLEDEIHINIDMGLGSSSATAWGCDLTYDYVKINGDYRT